MNRREALDVGPVDPDPMALQVLGGKVSALDGGVDVPRVHPEGLGGVAHPHEALVRGLFAHSISAYLEAKE